jgi:hypothetical protein
MAGERIPAVKAVSSSIRAALAQPICGACGAVHRLRKRFREVFRAQIAETVSNATAVEDEARHVVAALNWE